MEEIDLEQIPEALAAVLLDRELKRVWEDDIGELDYLA